MNLREIPANRKLIKSENIKILNKKNYKGNSYLGKLILIISILLNKYNSNNMSNKNLDV